MEIITIIYKCECGKNFIILDENLEDADINPENVECPCCHQRVVSSIKKRVSINNIMDFSSCRPDSYQG